jgi:hypothetical protein
MSAPIATTATSTPTTKARRTTAVAAGVVAALAVWSLVHLVAGVDLAVGNGANRQAIGPVPVTVVSIATGLAGWALLAGLERFSKRPRRIWTITAVIVLLISLLGTLGGIDASSKLGLAALHLVVGGTLILTMSRTAR